MEYFDEKEKLLLLEGALVSSTLAEGLDCLKNANIYQKGLYYQAFLSLSTGIERLLKLIVIYQYRISNNGKFPENKDIKGKGHDLLDMVRQIAPHMLEDELYSKIIVFLSDFNMTTRYYNLDMLTGRQIKLLNPLREWSDIQNMIAEEYNIKIESIQNKDLLASMLNQNASVLYLDNNLNQLDDFIGIIDEFEKREALQGYDILIIFKIIKSLVNILTRYEKENNLFPCLREFFDHFRGNYTDSEIRRKKCWRDIIV